jgi:hypothetical protein
MEQYNKTNIRGSKLVRRGEGHVPVIFSLVFIFLLILLLLGGTSIIQVICEYTYTICKILVYKLIGNSAYLDTIPF